MKTNQKVLFFLGFATAVLGSGSLIINQDHAYADQEIRVNLTVENHPASVSAVGPESETLLNVGATMPDTVVTYKNAKTVKVALYDPSGVLVSEKVYDVAFSPDDANITVSWGNVLKDLGAYTIKTSVIGTDGVEVAGNSIVFYYGSKPAVPNTGETSLESVEKSTSDSIAILLATAAISMVALFFALKNLSKRGIKHE